MSKEMQTPLIQAAGAVLWRKTDKSKLEKANI